MKFKSAAIMFGDSTPVETVGDGIQRQILGFNDSILMARVEFESGSVGSIHSHPHTQVTYVESGEFDVNIDGVETRVGPGDGFCVHPGVDHGAVCRKSGALLDVFSPVREDFLAKEQKQ